MFEPGGKATLKGSSNFILQPDGSAPNHIFGLRLTEDSNVSKFKETIDTLIKNLSVRPRTQQLRKFYTLNIYIIFFVFFVSF